MLELGSSIITGTKIRNNESMIKVAALVMVQESIRLGSSATAKAAFNTELSGNTIENCDTSDTELVTVKSSNNDIHDNRFINCNSGVTFKHGSFNKYRNNININTGLRVYGHNNEIINNQFLRDSHNQLRQCVIGNADHADDGVLGDIFNAFYSHVHDCIIKNNIIESLANIAFCLGNGSGSFKPTNNQIVDNIFIGSQGTLVNTSDGASWTANIVTGNILWLYRSYCWKHANIRICKKRSTTD